MFATALAVPASAQASSYQDAVLADNPLTYLRMEEAPGGIVQDFSPNDRDGQLTGMAALVGTGPFLAATNAVSLGHADGVTASVGARSGSAELWVNPGRLRRGEEAGFIAHGDPASNGWAVGVGAKRKLTFVTGNARTRSKVSLPSNAWSMLNVSWSAGKVTFTVNGGATTKAAAISGSPSSADGGVVLGGDARGAFSGRFAGRMDEVALYSEPLTATDMQEHFAAAKLPVNTAPVVVDGTPVVGSPIGVQPGQWTGSTAPSTYQWQRCDEAGDDCDDIPGATQAVYIVTEADACSTLRVIETRSNANGTRRRSPRPARSSRACPGRAAADRRRRRHRRDGPRREHRRHGHLRLDGRRRLGHRDPLGGRPGRHPDGHVSTGAAAVATDAAVAATSSAGTATCLKLVSGRRTVKLGRLGTLRLRTAGNGCLKPGSPLRLSFAKARGKQLKSVKYRFAGKALRITKRRGFDAAVTSAKLRAGVQVLKVRVAPRAGKARTVTLKLRFAKA
jgi:hypothetical protein